MTLLLVLYFWQNLIDQCQEGRQEMLSKADQLLSTISRRREKVSMMIITVMVIMMVSLHQQQDDDQHDC